MFYISTFLQILFLVHLFVGIHLVNYSDIRVCFYEVLCVLNYINSAAKDVLTLCYAKKKSG